LPAVLPGRTILPAGIILAAGAARAILPIGTTLPVRAARPAALAARPLGARAVVWSAATLLHSRPVSSSAALIENGASNRRQTMLGQFAFMLGQAIQDSAAARFHARAELFDMAGLTEYLRLGGAGADELERENGAN
jgi:hypothetical protein